MGIALVQEHCRTCTQSLCHAQFGTLLTKKWFPWHHEEVCLASGARSPHGGWPS